MRRLGVVLFLAGSMLGVGCAPTAVDTAQTETAGEGTFALTVNTDYDVAGSWTFADTVVQFQSHMSEAGVSTVRLTVNSADFETKFDYFTHAWESDGHQNTLFRQELNALTRLATHLDTVGTQNRPWERLYAVVSQHAAAPAGYTFLQRSGSPASAQEVPHRESNAVWNDGVTYICTGGNGRNFSNNWDSEWAQHDSLSGEGGSGRNATSPNAYHGYMWTYSPGGCQVGGSRGPGSCEGRCGAGCPRTYNFYFTYDCFDHDICGDYHPAAPMVSYSGDCGYEFSDADGDFAGGTSAGYYWECPGSVPSNCPDDGNAVGPGT